MSGIELLGWAGFAILIGAWIPQTWQTIKMGKTDISLAFILMYVSSSLLLTVYSILTEDLIFTVLNAMLTVGSAINLYYKLNPRKEELLDG
ncbi:MAG: PQ-loop repeat-containing protein [Balneola sp.]|jgi:MtN3 and saliva related transmembrane protein|tara:strand:+ start:125915 stop:126187 length:273 start_codon:yes stop_codon:yes gene_type:complete